MKNYQYLVLSDLDGTLTEIPSSWQFIMEWFDLCESKGKYHLNSFLKKEITYDEFIRLDVVAWKGITSEDYLNAIKKIKFRSGVKELFNFFSETGARIYIISSGLMDLAVRAKNLFPVHEIYANVILKENGYLNGKYIKNVGWNDKQSKEMIVKRILNENSKSLPIIAFGDSSGDSHLINNSDLSFSCFSFDEELNRTATHVINEKSNFFSIPKIITKFLKEY